MHTVGELVQLLEKVPGDEAEEDMLSRHIYKGGSHLCQLNIAVIGLALQIYCS